MALTSESIILFAEKIRPLLIGVGIILVGLVVAIASGTILLAASFVSAQCIARHTRITNLLHTIRYCAVLNLKIRGLLLHHASFFRIQLVPIHTLCANIHLELQAVP